MLSAQDTRPLRRILAYACSVSKPTQAQRRWTGKKPSQLGPASKAVMPVAHAQTSHKYGAMAQGRVHAAKRRRPMRTPHSIITGDASNPTQVRQLPTSEANFWAHAQIAPTPYGCQPRRNTNTYRPKNALHSTAPILKDRTTQPRALLTLAHEVYVNHYKTQLLRSVIQHRLSRLTHPTTTHCSSTTHQALSQPQLTSGKAKVKERQRLSKRRQTPNK